MKNLINYINDYTEESLSCKHRNCGRIGTQEDYIKANRKASREEEIEAHGHPINHNRVWKNKKAYNRKPKHKNIFN